MRTIGILLVSIGAVVSVMGVVQLDTEAHSEKQRADSLQSLLDQCSDCCNDGNLGIVDTKTAVVKHYLWRDSVITSHYGNL